MVAEPTTTGSNILRRAEVYTLSGNLLDGVLVSGRDGLPYETDDSPATRYTAIANASPWVSEIASQLGDVLPRPVAYEGDDKVVFDPDAMEIDMPYTFWFLGHWMIVRKLRDNETLDFFYLPDPYDSEE